MFLGKGVLKICSKFTREHSCWTMITIKLQSNVIEITLRLGCSALLCDFIEITLGHEYSPGNLLYIFKTPFPKNTSGGLLLFKTVSNIHDGAYIYFQRKAPSKMVNKVPNMPL